MHEQPALLSPLLTLAPHPSPTFRWGSRILPYRVRVPLPIEVDQHLVFAAADFARMLAEQMPGDSWPGSRASLLHCCGANASLRKCMIASMSYDEQN